MGRLIHAKLIIEFTPKNFPSSWSHTCKYKTQTNERLANVKEKWSTIKFNVFVLSFIFFGPMSQTIKVINTSGTCYFLHASIQWHVCWCVCMQSHTSNQKDWYSRKSAGSWMKPWRTSALTGYCCEDFPSRTTWSCLLLRKEEIKSNIWPEIP